MKWPRPRRVAVAVVSIHATVYSQLESDSEDNSKKPTSPLNRTVSASIQGPEMGRRSSSTHSIRPVSPSPPTVAANQSAFSPGEQRSRVPSDLQISRADTWLPNEPDRW